MESIIKESTNLFYETDGCITKLLKARLDKDSDKEGEAIFKMESLMIETMQHLSWLVGELKGNSLIKWQTGEPKEEGWYLATCKNGAPELFVALVYEIPALKAHTFRGGMKMQTDISR